MKNITGTILITMFVWMLVSCDDLLDRYPETSLSPETFYSSESELELATNRFYLMFSEPDDDATQLSDIEISISQSDTQKGTRTSSTVSWSTSSTYSYSSWAYLRYINYYLEHSDNCTIESVRTTYDAVAYFFRALFYFDKLKYFGGVPYFDAVISDTDEDTLYKDRDSRGYVAQKIMEDLDRAIEGLPDSWSSDAVYRLSKDAARAFKARVALFEGTWRKYHDIADEVYADDDTITLSSDYFLNLAVEAAQEVMDTGSYSLYSGDSYGLGEPYREYFILEDAETSETILARRYCSTDELMVRHGVQFTLKNQRYSITRPLTYHYLMSDGSFVSSCEGYEADLYVTQFQDRDPRMSQSLGGPGYIALNDTEISVENCKDYDRTGYRIIKFISDDTHDGATTSTTDYALFRYAEVLLNYAEAKAELGTITQDDLDKTINVIRARVDMPDLELTTANSTIDPFMETYYPHVDDGSNKGVILEIRRERTVELLCEGFRLWDMLRWHEGQQICSASSTYGYIGCYFPSLGEYDMTGDEVADLCVYSGTKPSSDCDEFLQIGDGKDAVLTGDDYGYIVCFADITYEWEEKDYLWPIPLAQIQEYEGHGYTLTQNPGY